MRNFVWLFHGVKFSEDFILRKQYLDIPKGNENKIVTKIRILVQE
jgi:hypothetical protein